MSYLFESSRLGFRSWKEEDLIPFAQLNADPEAMQFFPSLLSKEESDAAVARYQQEIDEKGAGLWAVELKSMHEFIGFIGFHEATFESAFTPCMEIGWRLDKKYWNQGLATEGALKCFEFAKNFLPFSDIYSFTAVINKRSERVMQKIGMKKEGEFDHPRVPQQSPLRRHVLYKIKLHPDDH
jgi:ribosomal-protein-alanine N-acetyltransferase